MEANHRPYSIGRALQHVDHDVGRAAEEGEEDAGGKGQGEGVAAKARKGEELARHCGKNSGCRPARSVWVSGRLSQAAASTLAPMAASSQKPVRQPAYCSSKPPSTGAIIGATTKAMVM